MLSKSATEQVIQALKEVMSDFNKNLTEQFGDNFKALDESVININKEAQAITETMSDLSILIKVNQHQITELERYLGAFKEMKELAVKAISEMQKPLSGVMSIR